MATSGSYSALRCHRVQSDPYVLYKEPQSLIPSSRALAITVGWKFGKRPDTRNNKRQRNVGLSRY